MCPHEREAEGNSRQTQREEGDVGVEAETGGRTVIVLFSKNFFWGLNDEHAAIAMELGVPAVRFGVIIWTPQLWPRSHRTTKIQDQQHSENSELYVTALAASRAGSQPSLPPDSWQQFKVTQLPCLSLSANTYSPAPLPFSNSNCWGSAGHTAVQLETSLPRLPFREACPSNLSQWDTTRTMCVLRSKLLTHPPPLHPEIYKVDWWSPFHSQAEEDNF